MVDIKRLDHFGLVAGTVKDLKLIEMIDNRVGNNDLENITTGEAVAGMIINGLGFTQLPMTLTPNFFELCGYQLSTAFGKANRSNLAFNLYC